MGSPTQKATVPNTVRSLPGAHASSEAVCGGNYHDAMFNSPTF